MDAGQKKYVKVRVNASGKRLLGIVGVPPPYFRVSDFLNSHGEFLRIRQERADIFVLKEAVSYLEALEEGADAGSRPKSGEFRRVTVALKGAAGSFKGEIFIPQGANLVETLNKARSFLSFRNVEFENSTERYAFIAAGKREILVIQADLPAGG